MKALRDLHWNLHLTIKGGYMTSKELGLISNKLTDLLTDKDMKLASGCHRDIIEEILALMMIMNNHLRAMNRGE